MWWTYLWKVSSNNSGSTAVSVNLLRRAPDAAVNVCRAALLTACSSHPSTLHRCLNQHRHSRRRRRSFTLRTPAWMPAWLARLCQLQLHQHSVKVGVHWLLQSDMFCDCCSMKWPWWTGSQHTQTHTHTHTRTSCACALTCWFLFWLVDQCS